MEWTIRPSTPEDLEEMLELYAQARRFMAENGNPDQWGDGYPPRAMLEEDIRSGCSYVCCGEDGRLLATFFFTQGEEPTYREIFDGAWLDDAPYGVVHRITARQGTKGVASYCLNWCFARCGNLRIDTHRKNLPMQRALARNSFVYCGVIYVRDGSERIAFQKNK